MSVPYGFKPIREVLLLRSPVLRDDNFKPNPGDAGSNWTKDAGVTATSDGDILSLSGTTSTNGITRSGLSISTTTYPKLVVRGKGSGTLDILVTFSVGTQTLVLTLTGNQEVSTFTLTTAKTVNSIKLQNQSVAGTNSVDLVSQCKNTPIKLHDEGITNLSVERATFAADLFNLVTPNEDGVLYDEIDLPDPATASDRINTLYIWLGYLQDDLSTRTLYKVFGGPTEEYTPQLGSSDTLNLSGRGWAQALLHVLASKEYGSESDNPTLDQIGEMITDIFDSFVNASGTGWQISKSYLQAATTTAVYLIFKNSLSFDAIKELVDLTVAAGVGKEFWVDPAENAHLAPIGSWGSDPNPSSYPNALDVGKEHIVNNFRKTIFPTKNLVKYVGAIVKPSNRDWWTEGLAIGNWAFGIGGVGGTSSVAYDTATFKVPTTAGKSVKGNWSGQSTGSTLVTLKLTLPATIDVTKLGGKVSPPRLILFVRSDQSKWSCSVDFISGAGSSNAFTTADLFPGVTTADGFTTAEWRLYEFPFGPYGASTIVTDAPNWNDIRQLWFNFHFDAQKVSGNVHVDGLYMLAQRAFIAKDSTLINQSYLRETSRVNPNIREESVHRNLAKAELFRLRKPIIFGTIRVPGIPDALPGQNYTVTARSAKLTAKVLRAVRVLHEYGESFTTTLDLTDDLTNYHSLSPTEFSNMLLGVQTSPFRKKEEHDVAQAAIDPTVVFDTDDYPS